MDFSALDWLESSRSTEHNYESETEIPGDDWWNSIFGISNADATGDRAILEPTTAALHSVTPSSNSGSHSPSLHSSSNPYVGA